VSTKTTEKTTTKKDDKVKDAPEMEVKEEKAAAPEAATEAPQQAAIKLDESHLNASYANFCRVSSTPEEMILDMGLNPQPFNPNMAEIQVSQRIIMNHYTAKRLLSALVASIQRHEQAFGVLETDIRKRIQAQ